MTVPGISFYDFICKLIPGTLIWAPWISESNNYGYHGPELLWYIILFSGFYLTGIIWEFLMTKFIFGKLRQCPDMLIKAKKKFYNTIENPDVSITCDPKKIKLEYVNAYTLGLKHNVLRDLPILESHENFLKTNWFIIGYYTILTGCCPLCPLQVIALSSLVIAFGAVPFIWYWIQIKIYHYVWEAEYNLKTLSAISQNG